MPSYTRKRVSDNRLTALDALAAVPESDRGPWPSLVRRLRTIVSFDDFAFSGLDVEGCRVGRGVYLGTNLPQDFTDFYTRERMIEVDPLAKLVSEGQPVARWDAIDSCDLGDSRARQLCDTLKRFNVLPRTSFTLWSSGQIYGAATFMRKKPFTDSELMTLDTFSAAIHSALAKPIVEAVNQRLGLLKGEVICLKLAAEGLTSEEISKETTYTADTVNSYIKSAQKKLKAQNRTHAVAEAFRRKIIN